MATESDKIFVMDLGGSVICPDKIDADYLKSFRDFIIKEIAGGRKFVIIVGGGNPARSYQQAAGEVAQVSEEDKDWLGIHATRLNAHLLRTIFAQQAHPVILKQRNNVTDFGSHSVIIGAGWQPGWSTDFVAVQTAVDFNAKRAIILGKPAYVYDKDNQRFPDAQPLPKLKWDEYLKLIPSEWSPGIHAPVDPIAARLAQKEGIEVIVADGKDLNNLKNILDNNEFNGTVIN